MYITAALPLARTAAPARPVSVQAEEPSFRDTVVETVDTWGHQGKKLGALALVAAGTYYLPVAAIYAAPSLINGVTGVGLAIGSMALLATEEKYLGLGKKAGQAVGSAVGAAVGVGKHLLGFPRDRQDRSQPIELPQQAPTGRKPREALLPRLLHAAHEKLTGEAPSRPQAVELGEGLGATAAILAVAYSVPNLVTSVAGLNSPAGIVASTLAGPLVGMIVGGWEENSLGLGRAVGELAGRGVHALKKAVSGPPEEGAPPPRLPDPSPSLLKQAFLHLNGIIAEPIIGFLVDVTMATNPMFAEKPIQTIAFQDRPAPTVNRERLVENFISLAGVNGASGKEAAVSQELGRRLDQLGIGYERRDDGTIIATIAPSPGQEDAPTVLLSAHQDTVHATSSEAIRNNGRKIYTDGSHILGADDRAGLAEILEGVQSVLEQNLEHPEVKLVFPVDEERGLVGASRLAPEDISQRPTLGFVVDALSVRDVHLTNDAVIVNPRSVKYNFSQEDPLVQVVFRSMARAGLEPRPIAAPILTGAGSDANTPAFNSQHIRSLAVGAGERDIHTTMEHILVDDLEQAARHVVGYLTNSCDLKVEGEAIVPRAS